MSTVGACTAFGAICGSGPATAATMAAVALPEMKRYKYDPGFAAGTVAAGGSIGMMIPPSVVFIVYGVMTEQSIGKLFIADSFGVFAKILVLIGSATTLGMARGFMESRAINPFFSSRIRCPCTVEVDFNPVASQISRTEGGYPFCRVIFSI